MRSFFSAALFLSAGFLSVRCDLSSGFSAIAPSHKTAYVKTEYASLRLAPATVATRIEALPYNTKLTVINRTSQKRRVGNMTDYWYLVRLANGVEGWIFGTGISFSELPAVYQRPAAEKKPLTENVEEENEKQESDKDKTGKFILQAESEDAAETDTPSAAGIPAAGQSDGGAENQTDTAEEERQ